MKGTEKTVDKTREEFLNHINMLVNYWAKESKVESKEEALKGLAHSILATLDGENAELPQYLLIPNPHPEEKEFNINKGKPYYKPIQDMKDLESYNISGFLHELLRK